MNEKLIKELVRFKLNAAGAVIEHMPPEVSGEIRKVGRIILEALNERDTCKDKASGGINSIPVE